jgi:hypothetical protein
MNRKLKKTVARLGSRAVLSRGAAVAAAVVVGALVRRKLKYRTDAQLADGAIEGHPNQPGISALNPA